MKILLLYYSPWWNATAYYGVTLAQGLMRAGNTVLFGTHVRSPVAAKAREKGISVINFPLQTINPIRMLFDCWRLSRLIKSNDIDIVNTLSPQGHLIHFIASLLFGMKTPLVRTCCDVRKPKNNRLNKALYGKRADWLIFPCRSNMDRYHSQLGFSLEKTSVIYGSIDLEEFDHDKPSIVDTFVGNLNKDIPIVGIVARLSPEKGHKYFLQIARRVASKVETVRFVIVGKEEQISINSLRSLAAELGIDKKVHFTGYLDDPRSIIDTFSIGVITSRFSETISRATLEYMASSKPVVATNVNVLGEIIQQGKAGKVFDIDDVDSMADCIVDILKTEGKKEQWGANGRKEIEEKYTLERLTEKTTGVYKKIIDPYKSDE